MSVPKALAKMWRDEGWRGFMAGNGTNCIRIVPYSAVQFGAYNLYKQVSICIFSRDLPAARPTLLFYRVLARLLFFQLWALRCWNGYGMGSGRFGCMLGTRFMGKEREGQKERGDRLLLGTCGRRNRHLGTKVCTAVHMLTCNSYSRVSQVP
jgi:hypothetical protein